MRGVGIFALAAALAFAFATTGAGAQTTTTAPAGKPLALLAGLRPPHETKHKEARHLAHAKAAHEKTAAKSHRGRVAVRTRHTSATKLAVRRHGHHEQAITASAFAEEPPPQAAPTAPAAPPNWPAANASPANETAPAGSVAAVAPISTNAPTNADAAAPLPDPSSSKVQTIKITAANPTAPLDQANNSVAIAAAPANSGATVGPAAGSHSMLVAPVQETASKDPVGSAAWIAQVLAALGGAVAAGAVAWFLIGSGPIRTCG